MTPMSNQNGLQVTVKFNDVPDEKFHDWLVGPDQPAIKVKIETDPDAKSAGE